MCHARALFQCSLASSSPSAPGRWCKCTSCFPRTSRHPEGGGVSLLALSLSPLTNHGGSLHSPISPIWELESPVLLQARDLSAWLFLRALNLVLYNIVTVGLWQGLFKGAELGWVPAANTEKVAGKKAAACLENEGASVAGPALAQPCQLHWQCGQPAFPVLRTVSSPPAAPACVCVGGEFGMLSVGPKSVLWPVCLLRGINST